MGRWHVMSSELDSISVSWTRRGFQAAVAFALTLLWQFHYDTTGEGAPFDLEELSKDFYKEEDDEEAAGPLPGPAAVAA